MWIRIRDSHPKLKPLCAVWCCKASDDLKRVPSELRLMSLPQMFAGISRIANKVDSKPLLLTLLILGEKTALQPRHGAINAPCQPLLESTHLVLGFT